MATSRMRNIRMFKKIGDKLMQAAAEGGMVCPDCGHKMAATLHSYSDIITCVSCGAKASAAEWTSTVKLSPARADLPPATTAIRKQGDGLGGVVWDIPANGKFGFFMLFAAFWLGITITLSLSFLFAILGGGEIKGNMPVWILIPFFSIFYLIGFGVLYVAIREKFMKQRLSVSGGEVTLRKELFGKISEKKLASGTVKAITQVVFYSQNYTPVFGIQIKAEGGKLRFGSKLTDEEKAWLVADIHESVFGVTEAAAPAIHEGGSRGEGKGVFSILIPGHGKGVLVSAIVTAILGLVFLIGGFLLIDPGSVPDQQEDGFVFAPVFSIFDSGFLLFWSLISGAFAIGGIAGAIYLLRARGSERRIEGDAAQVSIRTYKRGLVLKDVSYPREAIEAARSSLSGSANGRPMKRVELITADKAVKLAGWLDGDEADALVAEIRSAIGLR